ncbi:hypothetical protein C9374_002095 [Naegleria lovaniensis]|uniref:Uncharacterized protein n=1 Tax=Naegleria lovaniensis TaxID=51637 RepID=A0AA88GUC3_NAELO|nr:uncharacterized protein C9374_002095 [Naegleria lovaniensis]KAG2387060.1 hypothetical protein C9374_002095 [Naegleria lovaniensis]
MQQENKHLEGEIGTTDALSTSEEREFVINEASNSIRPQPAKPRTMAYRQQLQQKQAVLNGLTSPQKQQQASNGGNLLKRIHQNSVRIRSASASSNEAPPSERFVHSPSGRTYSTDSLFNDSTNSPQQFNADDLHSTSMSDLSIQNNQPATLQTGTSSNNLYGKNSKTAVPLTHGDSFLNNNSLLADDSFSSDGNNSLNPNFNSKSRVNSNRNIYDAQLPKIVSTSHMQNDSFSTENSARDSLPNLVTPVSKNLGSFCIDEADIYNGKVRFEHFSEIIKQLDDIKGKFDDRVNDLTLGITFFEKNLSSEQEKCREYLVKGFISLIKNLAQDKIPEVYLRSVPKFGGSPAMVSLHKALLELRRATTSTNPQQALVVKLDSEVSNEIEAITEKTIDETLNDFIGSLATANDRIARGVKTMKQTNAQLETMLHDLKSENLFLLEKINHLEGVTLMQQEEIDTLKIEMSRRAAEMDIIKEQVARRDRLLDEQRSNYLNELVQLQMKIYENNKLNNKGGLRPPSSTNFTTKDNLRAPSPISNFTSSYDDADKTHQSDLELSKLVKQHQQELETMIDERFDAFKLQYLKEKRKSEREHKEEMEIKEVEINKLKKTINNLERNLREMTLAQEHSFQFDGSLIVSEEALHRGYMTEEETDSTDDDQEDE